MNLGALGVTGTAAANQAAAQADVIFAVGTRLQDFTTGSWSLFENPKRRLLALNVQPIDAAKHGAATLVADAAVGLAALDQALGDYCAPSAWIERAQAAKASWAEAVAAATAASNAPRPSDAQVIGAVQRAAPEDAVLVCAAGGLPGELHKLWQATTPGSYHLEYGYSCMGYEIAGGLGVKMAGARGHRHARRRQLPDA